MTNRNDDTKDTANDTIDDVESTPDGRALINRREWLTTVGAGLAASVLGTGVVSATEQGYGDGAYGNGPYGDPTDEDEETDEEEKELAVATHDSTDVDESSATLNGELTELEGHDDATVYFEWGESGDLSNVTEEQPLDSVGEFDDELTDLASDVVYEFRAIAESGDDSTTGETRPFTTDIDEGEEEEEEGEEEEEEEEDPDAVPEIGRLVAEDASNPNNPHADASVEWAASIEDGELAAAELTVSDSDGDVLSREYDLSGRTAERSAAERIHHGAGETYTVELTVDSDHDTTDSERSTFES